MAALQELFFELNEPISPWRNCTFIHNNMHEKLLDSDWLRAVQFSCSTSAKSATRLVQKVQR